MDGVSIMRHIDLMTFSGELTCNYHENVAPTRSNVAVRENIGIECTLSMPLKNDFLWTEEPDYHKNNTL